MLTATLTPGRGCLLLMVLIAACQPWGVSRAQSDPLPEGDYLVDPQDLGETSRFNKQPTIDIELNRDWSASPFEAELTITIDDPEGDRLRCGIRFDYDSRVSLEERRRHQFDSLNEVHVRRYLYAGSGVRHIRVYCRDPEHRNGIAKGDAYLVLDPCDGNGFNACGTCGDLPDLPCASGDVQCEALVASVCSPTCGDLSITGSEVCDRGVVPEENCSSLQLGSGNLRCTSDCQGFDASNCSQAPSCPDNYPEPASHTQIPDPPDSIDAAVEGCRKIRVAWSYRAGSQILASRVPGLSGFVVYRDGQPIAETTGREVCSRKRGERAFIDDAVEAGVSYTYEIAALNNSGVASERVGSATVTAAGSDGPECADTIAPASPANLRRTDSGTMCRDIRVAVDSATDVGTGVRSYRYYVDGVDQCVEIASSHVSGGLRLQYRGQLHPGESYDVQVTAVDQAGNESARTAPLSLDVPVCEAPNDYTTAVVLATYPDMPPPPMTPADVEETVFGSVGSLRDFYEENSQSRVSIVPAPSGGVTEWFVLPHDRLHYCDAVQNQTAFGIGVGCDFGLLRADIDAMLGDRIDFDQIDRTVYAFYGSGGANSAVNVPFGENGLNMSTLVHETAHAWAARQHARGLTCPAGHHVPPDPYDPFLGCVLSEYGDEFDPMGSGSGHFSAHNKIEMGLLGPEAVGFARRSAFYTVEQLAMPSGGRKEIRVPLGEHDFKGLAYSFEYRRPEGWDVAMGIDGVIVRIVGPDLQHSLRTSDSGGNPQRLVFNPGQVPFVDPYRRIQVKVHSKDAERAVLHICR